MRNSDLILIVELKGVVTWKWYSFHHHPGKGITIYHLNRHDPNLATYYIQKVTISISFEAS